MNIRIDSPASDRETQRDAMQLLGRVFPDYWEQIAAREQEFPFEEISFAARADDGTMCGHAGVLPFIVSDGSGGTWRFAGIASVAVAPEYRGQGISSALCEAAAAWAQRNGFDALPLFTGKFGVYARHGWERYAVHPPQKIIPPRGAVAPLRRVPAALLSDGEKERIIGFYEQSPAFPGKVLRSRGRAFHAWPRIFREPEFEFILADAGYVLVWGGAVVELCTLPGAETEVLASAGPSAFTLALPSGHPVWAELLPDGWRQTEFPEDVYHGEGVMIRPAGGPVPGNLYFPCADKF